MADHPYPKRRDSKHRVLRNGESVRADGKYQFKYYVGGKIKFVYSWRLEPTDTTPQGKKPGPSRRELEKMIGRDLDSLLDPTMKRMTVLELVERYLATKTGVRPNTLMNYNFVMNLLQKELSAIKEKLDKQLLMLSDEKKRELEAEYNKKDIELKTFIDRVYGRKGELITQNEKVSAPIIQLIRKAVNEIALQEGYDMVVDRATGAVLFWKKENDLTNKVLEYLNSR